MALYLDSSALVKLVVAEPETTALRAFLRRRRVTLVSSALARVEVLRAVRPQGSEAVVRGRGVLARVRLVRVDDALLEAAAGLDTAVLRSLDAVHVASALALGHDLEALVTYDDRMSDAARSVGVAVRAPGAQKKSPPGR